MLRRPPATAILPLLLVFLCGITVGALAMSFVVHRAIARVQSPAAAWNKMTVLKWKRELNLNSKQEHELELLLDDFRKYYENVLADGKTRIVAILNDDQRRKFERMLHEKRKP